VHVHTSRLITLTMITMITLTMSTMITQVHWLPKLDCRACPLVSFVPLLGPRELHVPRDEHPSSWAPDQGPATPCPTPRTGDLIGAQLHTHCTRPPHTCCSRPPHTCCTMPPRTCCTRPPCTRPLCTCCTRQSRTCCTKPSCTHCSRLPHTYGIRPHSTCCTRPHCTCCTRRHTPTAPGQTIPAALGHHKLLPQAVTISLDWSPLRREPSR
jgi:hypothetical protein